MESIDPQLAQRVWDRVLDGRQQPDPAADLRTALDHILANRSSCARLSRNRGSDPLFRSLLQSLDQSAACLRGLHLFLTGQPFPDWRPFREECTVRELLTRCHSRTTLCLELCLRHRDHPRCGAALAVLTRSLHEQAWLLAQLAGKS